MTLINFKTFNSQYLVSVPLSRMHAHTRMQHLLLFKSIALSLFLSIAHCKTLSL